ncbi:MAG: TlpA disulfide reductase family protein [Bacteroidota bacterium]
MRIVYLIAEIYILVSCSRREVTIVGNVTGIPASKIYIAEAHESEKFIDSASYNGTNFSFNLHFGILSRPFIANLVYIDSITKKINTLEFRNHVLSDSKQGYALNFFIVEPGITTLTGIANLRQIEAIKGSNIPFRVDSLSIQCGEETNSLYRTQMMNFGYLEGDIAGRTDNLNSYLSIIHDYPNSQYLLSKIDENKSVLRKEELKSMLAGFHEDCMNSALGKDLKAYLAKKSSVITLKNFKIENETGIHSDVYNSSAKLNMVILWAGWCGPCRRAIPEIKKIYADYHDKGLNITSISIDNSRENWINAVEQEKMSWSQLFVPDSLKESFTKEYEVGSIPDIIFVNPEGKVIQRFIGYSENHFETFGNIIRKEIAGSQATSK